MNDFLFCVILCCQKVPLLGEAAVSGNSPLFKHYGAQKMSQKISKKKNVVLLNQVEKKLKKNRGFWCFIGTFIDLQ